MSIEYDSWHLLENFENICRFCLSQENCIQILHDGRINDTLLKAADIIISKVDENDGLPNSICQRCLNCVIEFVDFESRCRETYDVLQHVIELRLEANGDGGVIEEIVFSQEYIGLEEQSSRSLKGENNSGEENITTDCDNIADDFIITESDKLTSSTNEVFKPTQESCRKGLQQHNSLNHEQRKFKCDQCGKMFAMKYHLKEHEYTHSDARPYKCSLCDRSFKRVKNLNEHLSIHKRGI
ncbi:protein odd-skipped-related 1-like isoform X4 [Topomyia yanbarensis]|uniref:protein odd-skipped-related 1-like isoform X4 n=1 Tax=Topomyia yanbarensis TaxID=2498891 RepID=UPI00273C60A9|nr:protein odd-skipped-related 1-like isoform X4 [Topomyia yanbarensis]